MKRFNKAREVFKVKNHILKTSPIVNDIEVDIGKLSTGEFRAKIKTYLPRKRTAVAIKTAPSFSKALIKAQEATIKQIKKKTMRKPPRVTIRKLDLDNVA